jgi:hypothetical protein
MLSRLFCLVFLSSFHASEYPLLLAISMMGKYDGVGAFVALLAWTALDGAV